MKSLLIPLALILSIPQFCVGEETFISAPIESGYYLGPEARICLVLDQFEIFTGGRAGWIINHKFALGAAAYKMVSERSIIYLPPGGDYISPDIDMSYGGILFEYIHNSGKLEHFSLDMLIGMGSISLNESGYFNAHEQDNYFIVEPGANFILNFASYLRVGVGIGYKMAYDVEFGYIDNEDLSGGTFKIFLKLGKF